MDPIAACPGRVAMEHRGNAAPGVPAFVGPNERSPQLSKRNITWLIVIIAIGVLGWLVVGIVAGLIAAGVTLAVSEVIERRARKQRRASQNTR